MMMTEAPTLTMAYLDMAPGSAAEVLQEQPIEEAAALLETVPTRLAASVVNRMIPWSAARCLEQLSPSRAAAILRRMAFNDSVSLFRLINPSHREIIFVELSGVYAQRLSNSLKYPLSQVGAWMDANVPVLRTCDSVRDALRLLVESPVTVSHIFLELDSSQKFVGVLAVKELVRSDLAASLTQLSMTHIVPVSNRATLTSLAFDTRWDEHLFLPVTGRRGTILGGLSRSALRKGTHQQPSQAATSAPSSVAQLLWAFAATVTGLTNLLVPSAQALPLEPTGDRPDAK